MNHPPFSTTLVVLYGSPETISADSWNWTGFFLVGNITIKVDKRTDRIVRTWKGKRS